MKNTPTSAEIDTIQTWLASGSINIFGKPFAGKDTHGNELSAYFNAPLLGGGDILRNSIIPPHVKESLAAGFLVPIDEYLKIVTPYLSREEFQNRPLILSSVGRWDGEQHGIIAAAKACAHPIKAVVYLNIPDETVHKRFEAAKELADRGKRDDDNEQILENRLHEFKTKTLPVIDFYRQAGLLIELDSDLPREDVSRLIIDSLLARAEVSH